MSIAWHCDFEDCDEWVTRGSDEGAGWVIATYIDGRTWHFCSVDHLQRWDNRRIAQIA